MSSEHLSILSWNINLITGTASTLDPLDRMSPRPDVVTLQEVQLDRAPEILARLADLGYSDIAYSGRSEASEKRYGTLIASETQLTQCDTSAFEFPWPQLVEHAILSPRGRPIHVLTVHVPNGAGNGWKKIETLKALKQLVLALKGEPLIVTGDFNEPRYALQDGRVVTWGQEQIGGRWVVEDGTWTDEHDVTADWSTWDRSVRWFFEGSRESGLRNAFWDVAGHGAMEPSHVSGGRDRWFDHAFVSEQFSVQSCEFLHSWREADYSDHSPLSLSLSYDLDSSPTSSSEHRVHWRIRNPQRMRG